MEKRSFRSVEFYNVKWPINLESLNNDGFYFAKDNWDDYGSKTTYEVAVKFGDVIQNLGHINLSTLPYSDTFIDFEKIKEQSLLPYSDIFIDFETIKEQSFTKK